ncbi:MAG: hypothetical protein AB4911_15530 [Oscillochloridaceae bacterium umkhey_bin13]
MPLLVGCTPAPSYADIQATAAATGCWPDPYVTPPPVTVTPFGGPLPTLPPGSSGAPLPGPSPTALPTTTPYPRCAPAPGAPALPPWPTAVPNPPPYPTLAAERWHGGADQQTTLALPGTILDLDLATHPTAHWPVVAAAVWSGTNDPDRIMVAVHRPERGTWGPARQVDLGPAMIGRYTRTVAVGVTGDGVVHAIWGMSDPDFRDNDPPAGVWTSASADGGEQWSAPQRIATDCRRANDLAATTDGTLIALLVCHAGPNVMQPALVVRTSAGVWLPPERVPVPAWAFSEGSVLIVGEGTSARVVALIFAGVDRPVGFLISRPLLSTGPWEIHQVAVDPPGVVPGLRMWHVRGLVAARSGYADPLVMFTWTDADGAAAYALSSLDGGRHWGPIEVLVHRPADRITSAAPAYDPAADRLAAIWTCCSDDQWASSGATHYAHWSVPGSGGWHAPAPHTAGLPAPLVLGARAAGRTVTAQAANRRSVWVAWVEQQQRVEVRSLELNQLIPPEAYPATSGGQP